MSLAAAIFLCLLSFAAGITIAHLYHVTFGSGGDDDKNPYC